MKDNKIALWLDGQKNPTKKEEPQIIEKVSVDLWFINKPIIELNHEEKTIKWLSVARRDSIPSNERKVLLNYRWKGYTVLNESIIKNHTGGDMWNKHSTVPF
jgi:hypothetical protein